MSLTDVTLSVAQKTLAERENLFAFRPRHWLALIAGFPFLFNLVLIIIR